MSQTKSKLPSLFNPAMQPPDEIVANFVIRLKEFDELFHAIKTDNMAKPPQHYMIQGQRGYGKSTLLLRLKIEIENDKDLQDRVIPVMFEEEQYGILNLARLWEEVIDILADRDETFEPVAVKVDALHDADNPEEEIYKLLIGELKKQKKKLVLLLDNFNDLIVKFTRKENQRLREVLLTSNYLRFIGASSALLEFYYEYKEPLFDFFKVITLNELDRDEIILLLTKLGETYGADEIKTIIREQPERIDALRRLTGGVPRTVVLLFEIFVDDVDGNSFKDLEAILDRVTPLYKHRLDNLSTQQQAIIDAIAQNWDAVSTKEIAAKVRMPSKAVSSQLNQLEKNQLIKKIPTSTKNHLYQISERFFNIYYLMRLGKRRNRNRVLWLVKFFEICCGDKDLEERTRRHIKAMQEGHLYDKHAFYVSHALSKTHIPYDLQHELLDETKKFLTTQKSEYVKDIDHSHIDIFKEVIDDVKKKDFNRARKKLENDGFMSPQAKSILAYLLEMEGDLPGAIRFYKDAIKSSDTVAIFNFALLYDDEFKDFKKAEQYYKMAVEKGHTGAMNNLALLYENEFKDLEKAEQYYKMAIEKGDARAMNNLALLYFQLKKNKQEALNLQKTAYERTRDVNEARGYMTVLLWNDEIQEAIKLFESFFDSEEMQHEVNANISDILLMLMAKRQYNYVYKIFQKNKYDIRDKYKPVYYALLTLMDEKYSDELKKMGDELKESVQDVLNMINNLEKDFA